MASNTFARPPYTKRSAPPSYQAAWMNTELGNIQRAIPMYAIRTTTQNTTVTANDFTILCDATGGAIIITLPAPSQVQGLYVNIKRVSSGSNAVTIAGTVDGTSNPTLDSQYRSLTIHCDGSAYYQLASL